MTKKKPKLTLAVVRKRLRKERERLVILWGEHKRLCQYDSCGYCIARNARIAAIDFTIKLAGGRVNE